MSVYNQITQDLQKIADPKKAFDLSWFFKTKEGEYGYGDKFLGINVPNQRKIAENYFKTIALDEISKLIQSEYHEYRLTALFLLRLKFEKLAKSDLEKNELVEFYLKYKENINNWDLVDASAPYILGRYLYDKDRKILYELAESQKLWQERIAVVGSMYFIKFHDFQTTLDLAEKFISHKHDLMHKAVGWALREVGKKDRKVLEEFLHKYYKIMPRTMLRYAIEKFEEPIRQLILKGNW